MIDVRIVETPGLGDRSYLVTDGRVVIAIDPQRDTPAALARVARDHRVPEGWRFLRPATDDVRALAKPVFRHRVLPNFHARAEGVTSDRIVDELLRAVPVPRSGL